jgi:hypothetical protein
LRGSRVRAFAALVALVVLCAAPTMQTGGARDPAWSPDGRRLAFSFLDQIWIADKDGGSARAPTALQPQTYLAWSPVSTTCTGRTEATKWHGPISRASHPSRGRRLHTGCNAADHDRGRTALLLEVCSGGEKLASGRARARGGAAIREQGLRGDPSDDRRRRRVIVLSRSDCPAHRRRHGAERRAHHTRRSRSVPRDRTRGAGR